MPSDTMPSAASSRTGWTGSGGCGPLTWRVRAADGLLWCGRHSVANSITAIPALIAAWLAETGLSPEVRGPMAAPSHGMQAVRRYRAADDCLRRLRPLPVYGFDVRLRQIGLRPFRLPWSV